MPDILLVAVLILVAVGLILLLRRPQSPGPVLQLIERIQERTERSIREEFTRSREESTRIAQQGREEAAAALKGFGDTQHRQLTALLQANDQRLEQLRLVLETRLKELRADNASQLDQMRATVDEKLQGTLEKRLGESFRLVSERLEQVHKGLGEMQTLATGVGDLKKVLTNVKTRGTWGEVQLGLLLEQVLTPEQYAANVATKGGSERVEFAIRLPGRGEDREEVVWLPIDAKFPLEDYQRMVEAQERGRVGGRRGCGPAAGAPHPAVRQGHLRQVPGSPRTTDFGILFLPTEGLFAEVIRRPGLADQIQRDCRVVIAGPTTLWSILNSLQMGFRTLTIQKRSSEVWNLLAAVKTEWTKYGEVLEKVQKQLHMATDTLEKAQVRTRAIGRKLKGVQELPPDQAHGMLVLEPELEPEVEGTGPGPD